MDETAAPGAGLRRTIGLALAGGVTLAGAVVASGALAQAGGGLAHDYAEMLERHANVDAETLALGKATYQSTCAGCHETGAGRAPPVTVLGTLAPEAILRILTSGAMKEQAAGLAPAQKAAVAQFLTGHKLGAAGSDAPVPRCAGPARWFDPTKRSAFGGWGLDGMNGHYVPDAVAGLSRATVGGLAQRWALAFPGALYARSQPAFAGGALFVGGDDGRVHALDPGTGCAHWTFEAAGAVRMGITVGDAAPGLRPQVYFGDVLGKLYALDAATGKLVWSRAVDAHPNATLTGAPALDGDTLYQPVSSLEEPAAASPKHECCTFRGSVVAIDRRTGAEKWRFWTVGVPQPTGANAAGVKTFGPSGVATWSTPLVDRARGLLYLTTGDNYSSPISEMSDAIVAVRLATGKRAWVRQVTGGDGWNVSCGLPGKLNCPLGGPDYDFGGPATMVRGSDGRDVLVAGQKSGAVYGVDPATGALRWTRRLGRGGLLGGNHFGIAGRKGVVFVPISDTPDGTPSDLPAQPALNALDAATGKTIWVAKAPEICAGKRFCHPGFGSAITVTDSLVLAGSTDGRVRAYGAADGKLLWEDNTDREFRTVSGAAAHGGSMSGAGAPMPFGGRLFVPSGYGGLGKMPGNVLVAYSLR